MRVVSKVAMYDLGVRGKTDAAAKSLQSCPTLCNPMDWSLSGFSVHGILQARTLEWVAISFSNAWKWKVKVKLLSRVRLLAIPWTAAYLAPPFMGLSRQQYRSGVPLPSPSLRIVPLLQSLQLDPFECIIYLLLDPLLKWESLPETSISKRAIDRKWIL